MIEGTVAPVRQMEHKTAARLAVFLVRACSSSPVRSLQSSRLSPRLLVFTVSVIYFPGPHPSLDAAQQRSIRFRRDQMRPLSAEWLGFVQLVDLSSDPLLQILFGRVADTVTTGSRVYLPSSFIPIGI
jgi:hypothetical protein